MNDCNITFHLLKVEDLNSAPGTCAYNPANVEGFFNHDSLICIKAALASWR